MKKIIIFVLVAMFGGFTAEAQTPPAQSSEEVDRAITTLREGLVGSFKKGDIDGMLTFLAPDVVVTWQNGEVCRGKDEVRAFHQRMMSGDKRIVKEIRSEPKVLGRNVHGDWAVSWGNLHDHFILMDGSDLAFDSVFTAAVAKQGDRWLVTAFHVSVNAFENPVLGTAVKRVAIWSGVGAGILGIVAGLLIARKCRKA